MRGIAPQPQPDSVRSDILDVLGYDDRPCTLAWNELTSPERGEFYRNMLEKIAGWPGGTPDEIGALAEFLFGPNGTFISGSDILIDGGVTASYKYGPLKA